MASIHKGRTKGVCKGIFDEFRMLCIPGKVYGGVMIEEIRASTEWRME